MTSDLCTWREALPRPPTCNYNTPMQPVHAAVLMRCAERYCLNDYDAP